MTGPYDPPKAVVADGAPPAREKPVEVRRAVAMLWISLGLGVLNLSIEPRLLGEDEARTMGLIVAAVSLAVYAALTAFISAGHNWARIAFLVMYVIGCIPYFPILQQMFALSTVVGVFSIVQMLLQLGALVFVFIKPGSLWFRRSSPAW